MLELVTDLPDNVLGLKAHGKVVAEDYERVLIPALDEKLRRLKRVRLLYWLGPDFEGYSGAAAWEDARIGLKDLTRFERVAVVTDVDWVRATVKAFGFVMPGEVRVFDNARYAEARDWITEAPAPGRLDFECREDERVLILRPSGELDAADFDRVGAAIDPLIAKRGRLAGVMIVADHFPGWDDFSAFLAHMKFVRDHRKAVGRLALVSDDRLLSVLPHLAEHLTAADARHYAREAEAEALAWVRGD